MFMKPEIQKMQAVMCGDEVVPLEHWSQSLHGDIDETFDDAFWSRLSAPGYMDCTDWNGPHDTAEDAMDALCEDYAQSDEEEEAFRKHLGMER